MARLEIRIDEDVKNSARKKADEEGLNLSILIHLLLKSYIEGDIGVRVRNVCNCNNANSQAVDLPKVKLEPIEQILLKKLQQSPKSIEALIAETDIPVQKISEMMIRMQLKNLVIRSGIKWKIKSGGPGRN